MLCGARTLYGGASQLLQHSSRLRIGNKRHACGFELHCCYTRFWSHRPSSCDETKGTHVTDGGLVRSSLWVNGASSSLQALTTYTSAGPRIGISVFLVVAHSVPRMRIATNYSSSVWPRSKHLLIGTHLRDNFAITIALKDSQQYVSPSFIIFVPTGHFLL